MLKCMYSSILLTLHLFFKLSLPSSCIIRWGSQFFRLWNTTGILWFHLTLILQSLCTKPLYFPVKWQWPLSLTLTSKYSLSQIQHVVDLLKFSLSFLFISTSFWKSYLITKVLDFFNHTFNEYKQHLHLNMT